MGRVKQGRVNSARARTRARAHGIHDFKPDYSGRQQLVGEHPLVRRARLRLADRLRRTILPEPSEAPEAASTPAKVRSHRESTEKPT